MTANRGCQRWRPQLNIRSCFHPLDFLKTRNCSEKNIPCTRMRQALLPKLRLSTRTQAITVDLVQRPGVQPVVRLGGIPRGREEQGTLGVGDSVVPVDEECLMCPGNRKAASCGERGSQRPCVQFPGDSSTQPTPGATFGSHAGSRWELDLVPSSCASDLPSSLAPLHLSISLEEVCACTTFSKMQPPFRLQTSVPESRALRS